MLAVFKLSLLAILLPIATLAAHVGRDHSDLARRVEGNVDLHARQWNGFIEASKLSFYDGETGMAGSCGDFLTNNQNFVALTMSMMDKSRYCNKEIEIRWKGKVVRGVIRDSCPSSSCLATGLDLSPSLFSQLAPQSQGLIFGAEWRIAGSGGGDPAPAPRPPVTTRRRPIPTYVPPPRPTTTRRPVVDPPRPTPTRSSTRSTTRSSTSRSRTRTSTTASEEETTSAANVRGSNTSSNAPAPTVDLGVGPAAGFALPASAVDIPAGGFSNLLSLNQAFVQAVAVVAATKKSA